jgi:hypothetical protein
MTGTNCDLFTHNQSRSYLNHLVYFDNEFHSYFILDGRKAELNTLGSFYCGLTNIRCNRNSMSRLGTVSRCSFMHYTERIWSPFSVWLLCRGMASQSTQHINNARPVYPSDVPLLPAKPRWLYLSLIELYCVITCYYFVPTPGLDLGHISSAQLVYQASIIQLSHDRAFSLQIW